MRDYLAEEVVWGNQDGPDEWSFCPRVARVVAEQERRRANDRFEITARL